MAMSVEKAVAKVCKKYDNVKVISGIEYKGKYVFSVIYANETWPTYHNFNVYVNKWTGKTGIFEMFPELIKDHGLVEACKTRIYECPVGTKEESE